MDRSLTRPDPARILVIGSGPLADATARALLASGLGQVETVGDDPDRAEHFGPGRSFDLLLEVDVLVEVSGTSATRYLANDAATIRGIPMVWAAASGAGGEVGLAWDERGVDYRDVAPEPPASGDAPVPASVYPVLGRMVVDEVTALLSSEPPAAGRVLSYHADEARVRETRHRRHPGARRPGSLEERTAPREEQPDRSVAPEALAAELAGPDAPTLLDVREAWETALTALPGAVNIPLHELRDRLGELDPRERLVVYCHHGVRSGRALEVLEKAGFGHARHLTGGIDAWAVRVDPTVPRY